MSAKPRARVKIEGLEELQAKLRDPQFVKIPLAELIKDATAIGEEAAKEAVKGGTEQAIRSINAYVSPTSARVVSMMPKARVQSIEKGRKPGEPVALIAAARWVLGRPYLTQRRLAELSRDEKDKSYKAQHAIHAHGAKGKFFKLKAREAVQRELPRLFAEMAVQVEERWGR